MSVPLQKPGRSKQNYETPGVFIRAVKTFLGITHFAFDFAAESHTTKARAYWTKEDNALAKDGLAWAEKTRHSWGWLNSPYDNIAPWAKHCAEAKAHGGSVAALWPASVGANWFRDYVHGSAMVLALNGRLAFMPDKPNWLYPKDTMLCLFSPQWEPGFDVWSWKI